ncbi:11882_t:CDS:2 [Gigaspora margarita]|uniref:11882_t:CDS:1 n=1 Tax=Gigaspora margarita TaxID=4874 RepID=A0ABN7UFN5_GIGMA|nr:11882_t:CDS:2 [Gigaspora margarita]
MAFYTVPEKLTVKIFTNSKSAIAGTQGGWNRQINKWWTKQKNSSIISRIIELMSVKNLEVELNKIEDHNPEPQSIDIMEKLPIGQPYKKDAPNNQRIHNGNRVALL